MGNCLTADPERQASKQLDRYLIDEQRQKDRHPQIKVLILGTGESGKSTLVKQMKILHGNGFTQAELKSFRIPVFKSLEKSVLVLLDGMKMLSLEFEDPKNVQHALSMTNYSLEENDFKWDPDIVQAIKAMNLDPVMIKVFQNGHKFNIQDSTQYFMEEIERIAQPLFIPNVDDVLRTRLATYGISEFKFEMDKYGVSIVDVGGQRSERRKWIAAFEGVTCVLFVVAISEYNQKLAEDSTKNRFEESLDLFASVVNSRWFLRTSFILFLNKSDIFEKKLEYDNFATYFPDFEGHNSSKVVSKYMTNLFLNRNKAKLKIFPHVTVATNTENIRIVFSAVKKTLLKLALEHNKL